MNSTAHFEYVRHKYLIKLIPWFALYIKARSALAIYSVNLCRIIYLLHCDPPFQPFINLPFSFRFQFPFPPFSFILSPTLVFLYSLLLFAYIQYIRRVGTNVNVYMATQRNRYVFGLIGAPCAASAPTNDANKLVARISLDPDSLGKSPEERAASYLAGVNCDIDAMRQFFGGGQEISELFCYNHVDAQGKVWLVTKLRKAFARTDRGRSRILRLLFWTWLYRQWCMVLG